MLPVVCGGGGGGGGGRHGAEPRRVEGVPPEEVLSTHAAGAAPCSAGWEAVGGVRGGGGEGSLQVQRALAVAVQVKNE